MRIESVSFFDPDARKVLDGHKGMELTPGLKKQIEENRRQVLQEQPLVCECGRELDDDEQRSNDGLCFECWLTKIRDETPRGKTQIEPSRSSNP